MKTEQIDVDRSCQIVLRRLWNESQAWMDAANGKNPLYSLPVARMLSRDKARESLDQYFSIIDAIVIRNNGEVA